MTKILLAVYLNQMVRILWNYTYGEFTDMMNKIMHLTSELDEEDRQLDMVITWTCVTSRILTAVFWPVVLVNWQISDIVNAYKSAKKKEED